MTASTIQRTLEAVEYLRAIETWTEPVDSGRVGGPDRGRTLFHAYVAGAANTLCGIPLDDDSIEITTNYFALGKDARWREDCVLLAAAERG